VASSFISEGLERNQLEVLYQRSEPAPLGAFLVVKLEAVHSKAQSSKHGAAMRLLFALAFLLTSVPAAAAHVVAITYFDNESKDAELAPLRKGLADMLITDLSGIHELQLVERAKLEAVLAELELGKSAYIDPKTAQKLGGGLGAQYVMTGSYLVLQGKLRIDVRVVAVATGVIAAAYQKYDSLKLEEIEAEVNKLNPSAPDFADAVDAAFHPAEDNAPSQTRRLLLTELLFKRDLRPIAKGRHLEAVELILWARVYAHREQVKPHVPALAMLMLKRYPEDFELLEQVERLNSPGTIASNDPYGHRRVRLDATVEARAFAILQEIARKAPAATTAQLTEQIAASRRARTNAKDRELSARLAGLKTGAEAAKLFEELGGGRAQLVRLIDRLAELDLRPVAADGKYPEVTPLLLLMQDYAGDPQTGELLPGVGEYLFRKYPDAPNLRVDLSFILGSVKKDKTDKSWEGTAKTYTPALLEHREAVRALFRKLGARAR
jgi:TolB-like protein